jgi:hypothetical protein
MFSQVILQYAFDGPALVIDWVRSIEVDSSGKQNPQGRGDSAVDAKPLNANASNDEIFALAA